MISRITKAGVLTALLSLNMLTSAGKLPETRNYLGMSFVKIPAGQFQMGTTQVKEAKAEFPKLKANDVVDETPAHRVNIDQDFYLGKTEVTQDVWFRVMENKPGPAAYWQADNWQQLPMTAASWYMAERFVQELSKLDQDYDYRLPTEAEWEYAARAGSSGLRPVDSLDLDDVAWFINNSADHPQPVATREANAFGLYDMLGNVWEWVDDWYAPDTYSAETRINPTGPKGGISKVRRGGSYHCPIHLVRPGYRAASKPEISYSVQGFRVVAIPRS